MTISAFAQLTGVDPYPKGDRKNKGVAAAYRDWKREEAVQRQQAHIEDVAKTARDHNIDIETARDVVRGRKKMLYKRALRARHRARRLTTSDE